MIELCAKACIGIIELIFLHRYDAMYLLLFILNKYAIMNIVRINKIIYCMSFVGILFISSCCKHIPTPDDTKYLEEFHLVNFALEENNLDENTLRLYVDYSTCTKLGQNSTFFQALEPTFTQLTTNYYSIKGSYIKEENLQDSSVYLRLRNINEINYAELRLAAEQIANGNSEAVFLTDGEYFTQNTAKGHENDPWLTDALKKWILKGHDIHILSEPYVEGGRFNKKRFYILFTDDRNDIGFVLGLAQYETGCCTDDKL